eukprot:13009193-Heterocapsa_arctica.AAC.1
MRAGYARPGHGGAVFPCCSRLRGASEDRCTEVGEQLFKSTKPRQWELKDRYRKDGSCRLDRNFLKTDDNG